MTSFESNNIYIPKNSYNVDVTSYLDPFTTSPLAFKIVCIILTIVFIAFLIYILTKTKWLRLVLLYNIAEFINMKPYGYQRAKRKWHKIIEKMEQNKIQQYNLLVINADKIIGQLLEDLVTSFQAIDFETRLRSVGLNTFSNPKNLWEAHVYCQNYLLTNNYTLNREEAQNMLEIYEQALQDIEVI